MGVAKVKSCKNDNKNYSCNNDSSYNSNDNYDNNNGNDKEDYINCLESWEIKTKVNLHKN